MLVLTRKAGEQVIIQGNIRITVVSVGPGRVKIGIDAPADVKIDREEIHVRKQDEVQLTVVMASVPVPTAKPSMPAPPRLPESSAPTPAAVPGFLHNRIAGKLPPVAAGRTFKRKPR